MLFRSRSDKDVIFCSFVGDKPKDMECCHNNGIRTDARLVNLRWDTRKNNHKDQRIHGTKIGNKQKLNFKIANEITSRSGKTTFSVGAAFDFIAETKKESPKWLNDLGLEWAYRLFSEPKRLLHRYTIGNYKFLTILLFTFLRLISQKILILLSKFLNL